MDGWLVASSLLPGFFFAVLGIAFASEATAPGNLAWWSRNKGFVWMCVVWLFICSFISRYLATFRLWATMS